VLLINALSINMPQGSITTSFFANDNWTGALVALFCPAAVAAEVVAVSAVDGHIEVVKVVMWRRCGDGGGCWLVAGCIVLGIRCKQLLV
jgi:hypothetical protein